MSKQDIYQKRKSKAARTVDVQTTSKAVGVGVKIIRDFAESIRSSQSPSKRQRKELVKNVDSVIALQDSVTENIPTLLPDNCTKYAMTRLISDSNHTVRTHCNVSHSRDNMRLRTFSCAGILIRLPKNLVQYTTTEVCSILSEYEDLKNTSKHLPYSERKWIPSLRKIITDMLCYKEGSLIPCSLSSMFRIFKKFKKDPSIQWPVIGRPPILTSEGFMSSVRNFEKDEGRAVGKKDMNQILNGAKVDSAKQRGISTLSVVSPTNRTNDNYMAYLLQLDADRAKTFVIQQKSEARFIAERSFRNAVSFIMTVAVTHYLVGTPDPRLKSIDKATDGAKKLYKLIQKENGGSELKVVLPFFVSTTDDTTMFTFEGSVSGKCEFIVNKNENGTRSAFTKDSSSTDSLRGLRIRHSVSFNAVGNAAPLYLTVYGLDEEELPSSTCQSGVFTLPIPGLCYGGSQDASNQTEGFLVFLRSTKKEELISTDQINHIQYRNNVFLPFIEKTREHFLQSEGWKSGDPVADDYVWINWQVCYCTFTFFFLIGMLFWDCCCFSNPHLIDSFAYIRTGMVPV